MTTEAPEYLYHYTNVETLALILKNRTIRFSSLDRMDDLQEQKTQDVQNFGKLVFVSSWTDLTREDIPMWKMYSKLDSGVRIRLRKNPFQVYPITFYEYARRSKCKFEGSGGEGTLDLIIPHEMFFNNDYTCTPRTFENLLNPVTYTDDEKYLNPTVAKENAMGGMDANLGLIGKHKNKYWEFQSEWRYIITYWPISVIKASQGDPGLLSELGRYVRQIQAGTASAPFNSIDLVIADAAFADMEITLSPKISTGNKLIAETLVHRYNPSAVIRDSDLLGKL